MDKKQKMYQRIEKHGKDLIALFHLPKDTDPVKLCKQLFRLENKAHKLATNYCNGENGVNTDNWEALTTPILQKVYKLLNNGKYPEDRPHHKKVPIFINGDARGYALKINDQYIRAYQIQIYTDMGGYGIIAPDFREVE